jgi:predicted DNA-binding protein (MmcQ/YjbR family)
MKKQYADRESILDFAAKTYQTKPEYPWQRLPDAAVLRHPNGKWYGLIMSVPKDRLGLPDDTACDMLNVKCDPMVIGSLRGKPGFLPAYHMSKTQWVSILLDGTVPEEEIKDLLNISYDLTGRMRKAPKRQTTEKEEKQ